MGRQFLGIELKPSYFHAAATNLKNKEEEIKLTGADLACPTFNVFSGRETYGVKKVTREE